MNQARNLANLRLQRRRTGCAPTLATTERLIAEARGLAYDVTNMDASVPAPVPRAVRRHRQRRPMARTRRERWQNTLNGLHTAMRMQAQVSQNLARRRKRAGRPREPEPVGHRRAASHAGHESAARPCRPSSRSRRSSSRSRKTGPLRWNWRGKRRPPSAPAKCGGASWHRHAVHAAVRELLQQLTGGGHAMRFSSCWPCC